MIELQQIRKQYNQRTIIREQSFAITDPITWLYGTNGSGKTTLLKIISGVIPFDGDVITEGVSLKQMPIQHRQLISYATAEPLFPPSLSGIDLLRFVAKTRQAEIDQEKILIETFNMNDYCAEKVSHYSSGMTKKLSLAMAFLGNSKWILLDEPLITLDQYTQEVLMQLIKDRMKLGAQILFTSHQVPDHKILGPVRKVVIEQANLTYAE